MNLVQAIPELQTARLGGLRGLGYAEVITVPGKKDECHGVIVFDEDVDVASLPARHTFFEGIVYRDGSESVESFPVDVLLLSSDQHLEPGATFVAKTALN